MKTLHIISSLETGGAQKLLSELLPALEVCGVNCEILVFHRVHNHLEDYLERKGIKIISLDVDNIKSPALIPLLKKHIRNYDLAHVHLFPALYESALAAAGLKTPLVYTEHSTTNRRRNKKWLNPVERCIYNRYSGIIGISPEVTEELKKWLGGKIGAKIRTIGNGIDLDEIRRASPLPECECRNGILMVSRFNESKGQITLIDAIPLLSDKSLQVIFAGTGPNLDACRRHADEIGVSDRVSFLGDRSDVPRLIKSCRLGVQSSFWEGFGLTAVEIMAAGKPIVASDVDGLKQVVDDAGLLFKTRDCRDLALKINSLTENPVLFSEIAEKCYLRADKYSIQECARKYAAFYSEIIDKTRHD